MSDTRTLTADETVVELLGHCQATLGDVRTLHSEVQRRLERQDEPATLSTLTLTPAEPIDVDLGSVERPSLSLGVLNPNGIPLALGLSGGTASVAARAITVPPNALLVLPVVVTQLEVGADVAALAGNTAVVFVLRFKQVQPAFLGRGA